LKPYTDIRVRKAFQMAIDIPTIAKTFYGGNAGDKPMGLSAVPGYYTPFDEWPQQLKDEYTYNPEGAKKLLAEAGFPNGFKTDVVTSSAFDLDLLQIIKSYFAAIGVDMEIRVMDSVALSAFITAFKHDAMYAGAIYYAQPAAPRNNVQRRLSTTPTNYTKNNDPAYDEILSKFNASLDAAEAKKLLIQADNYAIAQHWNAVVCPTPSYTVWQPWLKGYMGEQMMWNLQFWYSRYWIDQNLKKTMGR
jgi:peptide/nickel transport system substrate-binding protein